MKKITIPKCRNPFVVILNGIRYEYESGQVIEVPKAVAEIIENHVDSKPKAEPIVGGGGGICNNSHVYFSDDFNKLPDDAVDGSVAVVKCISGVYVFNDYIEESASWSVEFTGVVQANGQIFNSIHFRENDDGAPIMCLYYGENSGDDYQYYSYDFRDHQWVDEKYKILQFGVGEMLYDPHLLSNGMLFDAVIYYRENGNWVFKGGAEFTDLASV